MEKVLTSCLRVFWQISDLRLRGCRSQHFGCNSSCEGPRWGWNQLQDHLRKWGRKLCHWQPKRLDTCSRLMPIVCLSVCLSTIYYLVPSIYFFKQLEFGNHFHPKKKEKHFNLNKKLKVNGKVFNQKLLCRKWHLYFFFRWFHCSETNIRIKQNMIS